MPTINLYNQDCMEAMADMEDNAFDLAIVDPPYGIGNFIPQTGEAATYNYPAVEWNDHIPQKQYFEELKRISKNRIIWGANYYNCFEEYGGSIIWDKRQPNPKFSRAEIASHTFNKLVKIFEYSWGGFYNNHERSKIHPSEKPASLYKWLLKNYANEGDRILDTHLGSGSIAIACHDMGYDLEGYEIDREYYRAARDRLRTHQSQLQIF